MAARGLNDQVINLILEDINQGNYTGREISILDLASGQGYNASRLQKELIKLNYKFKITCVDIDSAQFRLTPDDNVLFFKGNLNTDLILGRFDFIVGTEIIEHLENPYHFINLCLSSLKTDGICYLTTPNVEHLFSLLKQAIFDRPMWFSVDEPSGHIMPIHGFMIDEALRRQEKNSGHRYLIKKSFNRNCWPLLVHNHHLSFITVPGKNRLFGEINIWRIYENT